MSAPTIALTPITGVKFEVHSFVFCCCGWLMKDTDDGSIFCENRRCSERGKLYKAIVQLEEVKASTV